MCVKAPGLPRPSGSNHTQSCVNVLFFRGIVATSNPSRLLQHGSDTLHPPVVLLHAHRTCKVTQRGRGCRSSLCEKKSTYPHSRFTVLYVTISSLTPIFPRLNYCLNPLDK